MANRYNDQDYPRYYDRDDRYDSRSEYGSNRQNNEQRNRSGSGRENTQGGSTDYNRDAQNSSRSGYQSGYFGSDFGRGYSQQDRDYDDFASSSRSGSDYTSGSGRNTRSDRGDYTLYGYSNDNRSADRSGDQGGYGERTENYQSNQNYGYSGGGGSYARSYDRDQQDREHGGSSRYYGNQSGSSSYQQGGGQQRSNYDQGRQNLGQSSHGKGGYTGSSETGYDYSRGENRFQDQARNEQEERGFFEKATDQIASWFGDEDAARRRERDARENDYSRYQNRGQSFGNQQETRRTGRGPKNYRRSDERIKEDIYDRLTDQYYLDASDIEVEVKNGEVTLTGMVDSRQAKRTAEDIAEHVSGVTHLENRLRIRGQNQSGQQNSQTSFSSTNTSGSSGTYGSPEDLAANYSNQGLTGTAIGMTSSSLSDTTSGTGGTNAGTASSTTGSTTGSNPGTTAATSSTGSSTTSSSNLSTSGTTDSSTTGSSSSNTSETFSDRGVDRLSKPTDKSDKK